MAQRSSVGMLIGFLSRLMQLFCKSSTMGLACGAMDKPLCLGHAIAEIGRSKRAL